MKKTSNNFLKKPRKLLLLDGFGAILSAFLLGVVLVHFKALIGIPVKTLYFLASLPIIFSIYDFYYLIKKDVDLSRALIGIAILNLLYSLLSIGLAIYHWKEITKLGWSYIVLEVIILIILSILQFKAVKKQL